MTLAGPLLGESGELGVSWHLYFYNMLYLPVGVFFYSEYRGVPSRTHRPHRGGPVCKADRQPSTSITAAVLRNQYTDC